MYISGVFKTEQTTDYINVPSRIYSVDHDRDNRLIIIQYHNKYYKIWK